MHTKGAWLVVVVVVLLTFTHRYNAVRGHRTVYRKLLSLISYSHISTLFQLLGRGRPASALNVVASVIDVFSQARHPAPIASMRRVSRPLVSAKGYSRAAPGPWAAIRGR